MTDPKLFDGFDEWWASATVKSRSAAAKEDARRAFIAGSRFGNLPKSYRFQAGHWIVTVSATSEREAIIAATEKLNRRAEKLGATPPDRGWQLRQIDARGVRHG